MITEQDIRNIIAKRVMDDTLASIDLATTFEEAGLDSLDHASILFSIQEQFDLTIPDEDVDKCNSIQGILEYAINQAK